MISTIYVFDCVSENGFTAELSIPHNQITSIEQVPPSQGRTSTVLFKVNNYTVSGDYDKFLRLFADNGGYTIKTFKHRWF